jgi:peptide/nickel transport system substrate-binding protein
VLRRLANSFVVAAIVLATFALPAVARTRPHYGGTLHIETAGDPWQRPSGVARRLVFDGLTTVDASGNVRAALSVDWESQDANHRWIFRLRPGVRFHDSSPLTSIAVVASLNAACPGNCPWTAIHATGSSVIFTSDAPMPALPAVLATDEFLISLTVTEDGKPPNGATGTGPFVVNGFNNSVLTLVANDTCWQGRPFVDAIDIRSRRPVPDQWLDLSAGRADLVEVPAEELRQARQLHFNVLASQPAELLALQISDSGALANADLRAAIARAIDRNALANVIFQKEGQITASLLPQSISGYAFLFPTDRDLSKAQQLRGGITPPPLSLRADNDAAMQLAAQRIALNLREAGFNIQLAGSVMSRADLSLIALPVQASDPAAVLGEIIRKQEPASFVDSDALTQYKAEREFLERRTIVPLLFLPRAYATSPRVRDLQLRFNGSPDLASASLEAAP